jgi:hypothetical protein
VRLALLVLLRFLLLLVLLLMLMLPFLLVFLMHLMYLGLLHLPVAYARGLPIGIMLPVSESLSEVSAAGQPPAGA